MKEARIERLPVRSLRVDWSYHQPTHVRHVARLKEEFNPDAVSTLLVGRRSNGDYYIVDGKHRHEALIKLGIANVVCEVFDSDGPAHEAKIFKLISSPRTRLEDL